VAIWLSGDSVGRINDIALRRARLVLKMGDRSRLYEAYRHITSYVNSASYPPRDGKQVLANRPWPEPLYY